MKVLTPNIDLAKLIIVLGLLVNSNSNSKLKNRNGKLSLTLLVSGKVRHASRQKTKLDRSDERQKGDCERTKGEGEMSTVTPSFLTPH